MCECCAKMQKCGGKNGTQVSLWEKKVTICCRRTFASSNSRGMKKDEKEEHRTTTFKENRWYSERKSTQGKNLNGRGGRNLDTGHSAGKKHRCLLNLRERDKNNNNNHTRPSCETEKSKFQLDSLFLDRRLGDASIKL